MGSSEASFREASRDDLGHAQEGLVFNTFGGADDDLAGMEVRAKTGQGGAEELGRDDGDDNIGIGCGGSFPVMAILAGIGKPGRNSLFSRGPDISSAASGLCAQRVT